MATRTAIVAEARRWIGTPYAHQASVRGVGTDCLGLVRGVWRAVVGEEPEVPPPYTPDWAEALGEETLLGAARRHLTEIPAGEAHEGDVVLFRMALGAPAKHAGIVSAPGRIIHAYWGRAVCETRMVPWWERRVAAVFSWPGMNSAALGRSPA
ncbi:MAG: NlpC/P60 family protein [Alphaproteobacteria bacterium]|nr:NlpC/P60 family protein [Alphaproteobacteria bacterium]